MKLSNKQKKYIQGYVTLIQQYLNLQEWTGEVKYDKFKDVDILAEINVNAPYIHYILYFNQQRLTEIIKDNESYRIQDVIIHELVHIIVDPLYFFAYDAVNNINKDHIETLRESTVQRMTNIILKAITKDKKYKFDIK